MVYGNPCQVAWSHLSGFIDVPTWCNSDRETLLQILDYFVTGEPYFSTGNMMVLMDRDKASNHLCKGTFPQQHQELIPFPSLR